MPHTYFADVVQELAGVIACLRSSDFCGDELIHVRGDTLLKIPGTRFGTSSATMNQHDRRAIFYDSDNGLFVGVTVTGNRASVRFSQRRTNVFVEIRDTCIVSVSENPWPDLKEALASQFTYT